MSIERDFPYGAFNFRVTISGVTGGEGALGGFSDVSGIGTELMVAEYRYGNDKENHVRKLVGLHKVADVTLKRGLCNAEQLWSWIRRVRQKGSAEKTNVVIELMDESGTQAVQTWKLVGAVPLKWTGPTLAAKAHGDVAIEELTLSAEGLDFE